MSRRPPNPAAERAAQNQQTIKSLLKLEANKICADCKRNKHPRWASWNLGVFICIRCSGIHRGMGTHISRVKSVDLDSWTDEQLQSVLSWGNARANKYWESKLAAGHVPSEAKIENFIRTKYELKRWVMDGPMPDPASLDVEGDDDVPLSIVKEKQSIDRKESIRKSSVGKQAAPRGIAPPAPAPQADLIGGDDIPPRASTAGPASSQVPPKSAPAPPKAVNTKDSLLGLDFFGEAPAAPPRPASTNNAGGIGGQSRPDLKQSILSLYASAPRPQQALQQPSHSSSGSFGGFGAMQSPLQSPTMPAMGHQSQKSIGGGLEDAFAGLSFGKVPPPKSPQKDAFAGLSNISSNRSTPQPSTSSFSGLSGGSFFDSKPAQLASHQQSKPSLSSSDSFGAFGTPAATSKPAQSSSAALGDLFDWSAPAQPVAAPAPSRPAPSSTADSIFNLSANQSKPAPAPAPVASATSALSTSAFSNSDVWGNAWGAPEPSPAAAPKSPVAATSPIGGGNDFGAWSSTGGSFATQSLVPGASGGFTPAPKVAADEEFGGWTSSTGGNFSSNGGARPGGGFGNDDLFSNVWK
ncbi:ArfGap-domain-containing protein [Daldinia caldariorum]|uniref:ArfGap-domain-containing protein n=1 Tax=Daldinia caldariorum TaxID=326644 RepID=UPI0020089CFE|nr:ArfGap-domain-containing protein [Daldinia caldariorum]KAI1473229.1 ArfGap-domain-containing protein [Daldinia caldariorum]